MLRSLLAFAFNTAQTLLGSSASVSTFSPNLNCTKVQVTLDIWLLVDDVPYHALSDLLRA